MIALILVLGALVITLLYRGIDSKKREDSQLGFYVVFSLILLVIVLFVINIITK
jgi:hypothetical protein